MMELRMAVDVLITGMVQMTATPLALACYWDSEGDDGRGRFSHDVARGSSIKSIDDGPLDHYVSAIASERGRRFWPPHRHLKK
jgi:hypothetical protein